MVVGVEVGGLLFGDENKRNASASIEMTCTLLDSSLGWGGGGVTAGAHHTSVPYVDCNRATRQQQRLKSCSGGCFHVKCSLPGSQGKCFHHLSFHCCVLFTLFCLSRVGSHTSTFVCLVLLHLRDGSVAVEVMTWALRLGNHFHIQPKRAVMIAFDNQQSKRRRPPRVLLCAILWRGKKECGMAVRRGEGERVICGWRKRDKAQERGGGKTKNSAALRCNRPSGLGVDAWTPFYN